jgi:PspC domain
LVRVAAYLNIDPTFVRIGFVLLTIFWGMGLLVYIVMVFVVPEARSAEEKSAASGDPATAQEFIRRAKEGYYEAMKHLPDRKARREWRRQFRREMRANADHWRYNWRSYWVERPPVRPGAAIALPFLSVLNGAMGILFACTVISVLATHSVFGRPLPGGLPAWGAVVVLALVYGVLAGPLKMARHACRRGMGPPGSSGPFVFVLDAVISLVLVAVAVCLVVHFFPELREAWRSLPSMAHQAVDDIQAWWDQK